MLGRSERSAPCAAMLPGSPLQSAVRRIRRRLAVDLAQGVPRCPLLGFLLVAAPGGLEAVVTHLGGDLEALAVIGTLFVQQLVGRRGAMLPLGKLLQHRLVVVANLTSGGQLDLRRDVAFQEYAGSLVAAVEIHGGRERLEDVGQERRGDRRMGRHPFPRIRNSCIPRPSLIFAHVWRLTTIDLIRVRSPPGIAETAERAIRRRRPRGSHRRGIPAFVRCQAVLGPEACVSAILKQMLS